MKFDYTKYKKAIIAASGVFAVLGTVLADGQIDGAEGISVFAAISVAIGVYYAKNTPLSK
jgi:hypothetical protein